MITCSLCPRRCDAARDQLTGEGVCAMPVDMYIALVSLHMWEEPPISGTNGSGTIFFSGCPLGCVYCQNHEISRGKAGKLYTPEQLTHAFRLLEERGAHNISLVTGTHYIPMILAALRLYRPKIPVVWNSSGYETIESIDALAPYVDIWLPDYKYGLSETALRYSNAPDYPETAMAAICRMRSHAPENVIEDGIMKKGVIVRHLILPGNLRNSAAALRRIAAKLPGVPVSLMSQYIPPANLGEQYAEINRTLTEREYERVCSLAEQLGIEGYMQELASADGAYVPEWDI